jgi:hypothetical protein
MSYCFTLEEVEIYFNTKNKCYMLPVEGGFYEYREDLIYISDDSESIIRAQQKLDPLKHLGEEYEKIYFTYIPAKEFEYYYKGNSITDKAQKIAIKPFLKVSDAPVQDSEVCIVSGHRSAIMMEGSQMIRLKGCGNDYIGFNLAEVADIGPDHLEIRGAQFKNSCLREQYITNLVNKSLSDNGLITGNIPIGFYKYSSELKEGLKNEAPLIEKFCGLFYTNGDKRLGFDLFNSINKVLRKLLDDESYLQVVLKTIISFEDIVKVLPGKNSKLHDDGKLEILFNDKIYENDDYTNDSVFDLNGYIRKLENGTIHLFTIEEELLKEFKIDNLLFEELKKHGISFLGLVIILLSKLSYEIGYCKKLFEDIGLNWGTYDYHCNAHLDNFIILPKNDKNVLLAPIDFDLAFTRDQFIDIKYSNAEGIENKVSFDHLIVRERNCLLMQLIGINMIPNIEVNVLLLDDLISKGGTFSGQLDGLHNLLKENNAYHFYSGFCKQANTFAEHHRLLQQFIEILLKL